MYITKYAKMFPHSMISIHDSDMVTILIYTRREQKRLSLRRLAEQTGLSKTSINNYENGKVSPTIDELERIAYALDCRITDLFDSPIK